MKEKLTISIKKVIVTEMSIYRDIYFNMYMLWSIYFGYRVVQLIKKQEDELRSIYKGPLIKKLGLSVKYLKYVIYTRILVEGLGILQPKIILAIIALKHYLACSCTNNNVAKIINTIE